MNDKLRGVTRFDGKVPEKAHLLFYTSTGQAAAFEPGTVVGIVEDPHHRSPFWRMVIKDVNEHRMKFRCCCNPSCTVEWIYKLEQRGQHGK